MAASRTARASTIIGSALAKPVSRAPLHVLRPIDRPAAFVRLGTAKEMLARLDLGCALPSGFDVGDLGHPIPACSGMKFTLAPTLDGTLSENWYPAIGIMLEPTVMNWFDDPASSVKPVGAEPFGDG